MNEIRASSSSPPPVQTYFCTCVFLLQVSQSTLLASASCSSRPPPCSAASSASMANPILLHVLHVPSQPPLTRDPPAAFSPGRSSPCMRFTLFKSALQFFLIHGPGRRDRRPMRFILAPRPRNPPVLPLEQFHDPSTAARRGGRGKRCVPHRLS